MESQTKTNLTNPDVWIRLIYMIVFFILLMVARMVIWIVAVFQFALVLVTGKDNTNLRNLGQGTAKWSYQTFLYLTFNSDQKAFPFDDWPALTIRDEASSAEEVAAEQVVTDEAVSVEVVVVEEVAVEEPPVEEVPSADDVPAFLDDSEIETESDTDANTEKDKSGQ